MTVSAVSLEIFDFFLSHICLLSSPPRFICMLSKSLIMFYSGRIRTLVGMATYIFHRLIMGKVKIDIFFLSQLG